MTEDPVDLTPIDLACLRCGTVVPMRFAGVCPTCRDELRTKFDIAPRDLVVAEYEPKRNVTPNSVATRDD
jgi:hypothetical protein